MIDRPADQSEPAGINPRLSLVVGCKGRLLQITAASLRIQRTSGAALPANRASYSAKPRDSGSGSGPSAAAVAAGPDGCRLDDDGLKWTVGPLKAATQPAERAARLGPDLVRRFGSARFQYRRRDHEAGPLRFWSPAPRSLDLKLTSDPGSDSVPSDISPSGFRCCWSCYCHADVQARFGAGGVLGGRLEAGRDGGGVLHPELRTGQVRPRSGIKTWSLDRNQG